MTILSNTAKVDPPWEIGSVIFDILMFMLRALISFIAIRKSANQVVSWFEKISPFEGPWNFNPCVPSQLFSFALIKGFVKLFLVMNGKCSI